MGSHAPTPAPTAAAAAATDSRPSGVLLTTAHQIHAILPALIPHFPTSAKIYGHLKSTPYLISAGLQPTLIVDRVDEPHVWLLLFGTDNATRTGDLQLDWQKYRTPTKSSGERQRLDLAICMYTTDPKYDPVLQQLCRQWLPLAQLYDHYVWLIHGIQHRYYAMLIDLIHELQGVRLDPSTFPREHCYEMIMQEPAAVIARCQQIVSSSVDDIVVKPLGVGDAQLVDSLWTYRSSYRKGASLRIIAAQITDLQSMGVYHKTSNGLQLVAWVLEQRYGCIGMLHTLADHRGKGYAQLAAAGLTIRKAQQALQQQQASNPAGLLPDPLPFCYISTINKASFALFSKLGFTPNSEHVCWASVPPT